MTSKKLNVLMLVDFMASSMGSTDEEYADIRGEITEMLPDCELSFQADFHIHKFEKIPESAWDIFVMDWGGLLPGCGDLTTSLYEELVDLTYKFPNKLFILWSEFTKRYYLDAVGVKESERMLHSELEGLISPNVVPWFDPNKVKRCRLFLSLPETSGVEKPYYKYGLPNKLITPKGP
jgi:hypothetical protein